jgi:hypothetical protein
MKVWLRWLLSKLGLADYFVPAFRFQCDCGNSIAAPVPPEGTTIRLNCSCGVRHALHWTGKCWKHNLPDLNYEYQPAPTLGEEATTAFARYAQDKKAR